MRFPWAEEGGKIETVLSAGTEFKGNIAVTGPVRINGRVEGNVRCEDHLMIGREGYVRGDLSAKAVSIGGTALGPVEAADMVTLLETANLTGDISSPRLTVMDGAIFEGRVHMARQGGKQPSGGAAKRGEKTLPAPATPGSPA